MCYCEVLPQSKLRVTPHPTLMIISCTCHTLDFKGRPIEISSVSFSLVPTVEPAIYECLDKCLPNLSPMN